MKEKPYVATVVRRKDYTDELFSLWVWLGLDGQKKFPFKPGQYCAIGLNDIRRAYSIVSAPSENALELFVELVPPSKGGQLTPALHALKIGETVSLLPKAKGIFTFDSRFTNHIMVATVTGIAPFMSMIRNHIRQGLSAQQAQYHFYVLHGASYHDEFCYREELEEIMRTNPGGIDLVYVPTVSRPHEKKNASWRGRSGRVNLVLDRFPFQCGLSSKDSTIYACGHPGMIQDVKQNFVRQGWKVKEERYWK
jgi:ferredoxin--NADP+ reductase